MELTFGYRSAPGCCATCGSSDYGPVVDLQMLDPGVVIRLNQIYFCVECALAIGDLAGKAVGKAFVSVAEHDEYDVRRLQERIRRLVTEKDELADRLAQIATAAGQVTESASA
jgi:hypothetical protein